MLQLSEHFYQDEFTCKCGRVECDAPLLPHAQLVKKLEILRRRVGNSVIINSGIRCQFWNKRNGGEATSAHLTGEAVDIAVPDSTYRQLVLAGVYADPILFHRVGVGNNFVHVDISTTLDQHVCWVYKS